MKKIKVSVKGIAPLLMHRFVGASEDTEKTSKKKKIYIPKDDAEKAAYRNQEGKLVLPSTHFKMSLVKASTDFKYEGKKTYKDFVKSGVFIDPLQIVLTPQEYQIDTRPVCVQRARIERCRPILENWECSFTITITDENIASGILKEILETSGLYKGVGDNRPEYGRFEITKWEEV